MFHIRSPLQGSLSDPIITNYHFIFPPVGGGREGSEERGIAVKALIKKKSFISMVIFSEIN